MHRRQHVTAVSSLALQLPPSTHNPYFYDIVGNVSTSRFRPSSSPPAATSHKAVLPSHSKKRREPAVLELQPRYPLLGGWNYSFTVGYDLPLAEYVKMRSGAKKGQYVAAVPFLTPVKDVAVDNVRVEVRLPEGARCVARSRPLALSPSCSASQQPSLTHTNRARRDIAVHAPFPLTSLSYPSSASDAAASEGSVAWTYLDSTGRPTVVMTKRACTDRHGQDVLVRPSSSSLPSSLSLSTSYALSASLTDARSPRRRRRSSTRSLPSPTRSRSRSPARPSSLRSLPPSSWPRGCRAGLGRRRRWCRARPGTRSERREELEVESTESLSLSFCCRARERVRARRTSMCCEKVLQ